MNDCPLCKVENGLEHRASDIHHTNYLKHYFRRNQDELVKDKENVKVFLLNSTICVPKATVAINLNVELKLTFCIEITDGEAIFIQYHFLEKMPCTTDLSDKHNVYIEPDTCLSMKAGDRYYVNVRIKSDIVGVFPGVLAFQFAHEDSNHFFHIVRVLEVNCQNQVSIESGPVAPYNAKKRFDIVPKAREIYRGKGLAKMSSSLQRLGKGSLPEINIPEKVYRVITLLEKKSPGARVPNELSHISDILRNILAQDLSWVNYGALFTLLLQFEKVQMDLDIRKYDMKNVSMSNSTNGLLELEVPGLAENRPSVLTGDRIYVRIVDETRSEIDKEYQGIVHFVESTKVKLGFGPELILKHIKGMKYNVRFTYNKLPLKHMMLALVNCRKNRLGNLLFPTNDTVAQCSLLPHLELQLGYFNNNMDGNVEQQRAVKHIVAGSSLPAPYLLFGPPGTGKTMTVVEAIKQVWKLFPHARILVCTPSNSASDLITERLLTHVDKGDILRFYSASRPWDKVPQLLKDKRCTNYDDIMKSYFYPSVEELQDFKIIVSTLVNSGRLVQASFPKNHFTHIFIDESGHSVEPEAVIPVSVLLQCKDPQSKTLGGQLVLAGDPKQLGPTIRSSVADKRGLGISILKRLMESCSVYKKSETTGTYNDKVLTKLVNNYRSHPEILHLPNIFFYEGELKACANKLLRESLCSLEWLPKKGFPMIFHGVIGKDQREGKSPSYFNPQEVAVVIDYVKKLLSTKGIGIKAKEIGVITPYRQQVYKIKKQLEQWKDISAGSVDEFQGQERKIIIISTVRSNTQLMAFDTEYRLGFVEHPERFNVAVTRAQALLIIVGNPHVLSKDHHWKSLLDYCMRNNSYTGVRYRPPQEEAHDLIDRFNSLGLNPQGDNGVYDIPFSPRAQQEDPRWRGEM